MVQPNNVAIRKRAQIAKANHTMFLWVVIVSIILGIASVVVIFLVQMLVFNERVISEKRNTISTLSKNIDNVKTLKENIRVLDTNQALINSKARPEDQALQVILDALPSEANSLALGSSLQFKLLNDTTLESLAVDEVITNPIGTVNDAGSNGTLNEIKFRFSVKGDDNSLKNVLEKLEKSIRTIDIISLKIESQNSVRTLSVEARAYYEPAKTVELKEIIIK